MKISICIVLYNCSLAKSTAVQALARHNVHLEKFEVNIFLNGESPVDCQVSSDLFNIHDNHGENLFLLKNYQQCMEFSSERGIKWIVFFDQDTLVTLDYLQKIQEAIENRRGQVAFFPLLKAKSISISPLKLFHGFAYPKRVLPIGEHSGIDFVGLNSGSAYNIEFLKNLGPINDNFKLDYLDIYLSLQLNKSKEKFTVIDATLEHDLSILNDEPLGPTRARSILSAEHYYFKNYRGFIGYLLYKLRLLLMLRKAIFKKKYIFEKAIIIEYLFK